MNKNLKKLGTLLAIAGLAVTGLTACGQSDSLPSVTGKFGEDPKISTGKGKAPEKLEVKTLQEGKGEACGASSILNVHYKGQLWDGKEFDGNFGKPEATFPLTGVVKGWQEGLKDAKPGSRTLLVIPPDLGYGDQAQGDKIPANSTLVFVVDIDSCISESALKQDTENLKKATKTDKTIPGVTFGGELGAEPTITIDAAALPAEGQNVVLAEGTGKAITANDRVIYQITVQNVKDSQTRSSYPQGSPLISPVPLSQLPPMAFLEGAKVGSRVATYLVEPAQPAQGQPAPEGQPAAEPTKLVAVIDVLGIIPTPEAASK